MYQPTFFPGPAGTGELAVDHGSIPLWTLQHDNQPLAAFPASTLLVTSPLGSGYLKFATAKEVALLEIACANLCNALHTPAARYYLVKQQELYGTFSPALDVFIPFGEDDILVTRPRKSGRDATRYEFYERDAAGRMANYLKQLNVLLSPAFARLMVNCFFIEYDDLHPAQFGFVNEKLYLLDFDRVLRGFMNKENATTEIFTINSELLSNFPFLPSPPSNWPTAFAPDLRQYFEFCENDPRAAAADRQRVAEFKQALEDQWQRIAELEFSDIMSYLSTPTVAAEHVDHISQAAEYLYHKVLALRQCLASQQTTEFVPSV